MIFLKFFSLLFLIFLYGQIKTGESRGVAGNIKLVLMKNNQYWFSSSSPYAPVLNFYLAYEYCRNLGLQLTTLETKEEIDAISLYLTTSPEGVSSALKDYWTSGNRLGADTWLWMSNGEQLNSTFILENGLLQRQSTSSVGPKNCLSVRAANSRRSIFSPEVCEKPQPFICEQIRCLSYYYQTVEFPDPAQEESEFASGQRSEPVEGNNDTMSKVIPAAATAERRSFFEVDVSSDGTFIPLHSQLKQHDTSLLTRNSKAPSQIRPFFKPKSSPSYSLYTNPNTFLASLSPTLTTSTTTTTTNILTTTQNNNNNESSTTSSTSLPIVSENNVSLNISKVATTESPIVELETTNTVYFDDETSTNEVETTTLASSI